MPFGTSGSGAFWRLTVHIAFERKTNIHMQCWLQEEYYNLDDKHEEETYENPDDLQLEGR